MCIEDEALGKGVQCGSQNGHKAYFKPIAVAGGHSRAAAALAHAFSCAAGARYGARCCARHDARCGALPVEQDEGELAEVSELLVQPAREGHERGQAHLEDRERTHRVLERRAERVPETALPDAPAAAVAGAAVAARVQKGEHHLAQRRAGGRVGIHECTRLQHLEQVRASRGDRGCVGDDGGGGGGGESAVAGATAAATAAVNGPNAAVNGPTAAVNGPLCGHDAR